MKQNITLFLMVFLFSTSYSQNKSDIDSLYQVKNFLLDIRSTVNLKKWNGAQQLTDVTQLLEKGKTYEKQFPVWLKTVLHEDNWHFKEINRQFKLILQTLALYNSDLNANPDQGPANQEDLEFLNIRIPRLVDDIYHYCKLAEDERLKKIH
ncbi:hypothetical protein [Flavobacterium sp. MK4S-17]|uniref:hypothetical protein n=1 Tax=Flavobacterium sp. MK4S-17 TaxID=2543737 RepID=UPI001359A07B|nr:hypothetical protein [Flavobacterium sp. MK4S-17]